MENYIETIKTEIKSEATYNVQTNCWELNDMDFDYIADKLVKKLNLHIVSGSFIRPMTKACKVCVSYNKNEYPFNEPCKSCNATKGKDIELWRRPLD